MSPGGDGGSGRTDESSRADETPRVESDEEHDGTDIPFVLVVPKIPRSVREFVVDFREADLVSAFAL